jgi:Domain of unknown function (DUF1844)
MAEVQTHTESGEMTQRFIEFVMMQAQNAAFALGQIPHPQTGKGEVHLDMAKLFIDQLVMIRSKTRGNLNNEELGVLNNAISNLQMAFYEVAQGKGGAATEEEPESDTAEGETEPNETAAAESNVEPSSSASGETPPPTAPEGEGESKKKFTKSYGA